MFQYWFFLYLLTDCIDHLPFYVKLEQSNRQQMAKINDRVPLVRLGTSKFNDVFLKIYPYYPTSKIQEKEIGPD